PGGEASLLLLAHPDQQSLFWKFSCGKAHAASVLRRHLQTLSFERGSSGSRIFAAYSLAMLLQNPAQKGTPVAKYYAHSLPGSAEHSWQGLADHLRGVAELARVHAEKFGAGPWGEAAGLLHDLGKYSDAFQRRLRGDPSQVDHSTAGAQIARSRYGIAGHLIS